MIDCWNLSTKYIHHLTIILTYIQDGYFGDKDSFNYIIYNLYLVSNHIDNDKIYIYVNDTYFHQENERELTNHLLTIL